MTKVLAALCSILLALTLALGWGYRAQVAKNAELSTRAKTAEKALQSLQALRKKEGALLARREKENASAASQTRKAQQALQTAVQAAQPWAGGVVPPGAQDALYGAVEGLQ